MMFLGSCNSGTPALIAASKRGSSELSRRSPEKVIETLPLRAQNEKLGIGRTAHIVCKINQNYLQTLISEM
jgi:hypothetical protein